VEDLAVRQEEAWRRFRREDDRSRTTRERLERFFAHQHQLLSEDPDLTTIALRALTHPEARVARRVLALHDRTIGLLAEILLQGRLRGDLARDADVMLASRALFHAALGARIPWANGLLSAAGCAAAIDSSPELLVRGIGRAQAERWACGRGDRPAAGGPRQASAIQSPLALPYASAATRGRYTRTRVPWPSSLSTWRKPPQRSTMR